MTKPKDPANHHKRKPPVVITNRMIERMKELRKNKVDLKVIAAQFNVSHGVVSRYTKDIDSPESGRSWKSVKKRRLNYEAIFYDLACKVDRADICADYGISRGYLKNLIRRCGKTMLPAANEKLKADVIAAYADGDPIANIAIWSGRHHNVIRQWVGAAPGKSGNPGKGLDSQEIARLYLDENEPLNTVELAKRFGVSTPAINYHLRKVGVPISPSRLRANAKSARSEHYDKAA